MSRLYGQSDATLRTWAIGFIHDPYEVAWHLLMYDGQAPAVDPSQPPSTYMPALMVALAQMATLNQYLNERPIHSVWYGHADLTPETLPSSTYDESPLHENGIHQSLEWIAFRATHNTPLVPRDLEGRSMDNRLRGLQQIEIATVRRDEWIHWEAPTEGTASRNNTPRPHPWFG